MLRIVVRIAVAVVVTALVVIGWSYWRFAAAMGADVDRLVAEAKPAGAVITEEMLAGLPPPAQRYFRHAGVVGTPVPSLVRLEQRGRIRSDARSGWMDLQADEIYSTDPPAFIWRAYFPSPGFPVVLGRDEYLGGAGSIVMKTLGLVTVADEHDDELAGAGLMRYFNEMVWFPAAYLGSNVTIAPVDDGAFAATIADRGATATATLFVDGEGRLTNFRALRFNTTTRTLETWETPLSAEGERAGLMLPTSGKAVWKLKDGDFTYIELAIGDIRYDAAAR